MTTTIIGIHGLANKSEKNVLSRAWDDSLHEGLGNTDSTFDFHMVHWADLLYKYPLHRDEHMKFDAAYNDEPYIKADPGSLVEYKEGWRDRLGGMVLAGGGTALDYLKREFGMDGVADRVLGKLVKDLAFYYDENQILRSRDGADLPAAQVLKDELKTVLREQASNGESVILIAHSMGTIVAYDALRELGQEPDNAVKVPHLITIGSPLGLPHVKDKIIEQNTHDPKVRTPSIVTKSWLNYADRKDPVALDAYLKGDYGKNADGVEVVDDLVLNDYHTSTADGDKYNHHKSYGYLRTPELSKHISALL